MADSTDDFIKKEILRADRNIFIFQMLFVSVGYFALSWLLNQIRVDAPIVILWALIILQFLLYFLIFILGYNRLSRIGVNFLGVIPYVVLAVLGRVNDWEIVVIPALVIVSIALSLTRTPKLS